MNKKVRVMHILLSLEAGGMEGGVVNLVNKIDNNLFELSICCLEKAGVLEEKILPKRKKVFVMNKKPGIDYSLIFRLASLFRKEKVDIVHTHNFATYLYGSIGAILARVPHIIQGEHGDLPLQKDKPSFIRWRRYLSHFTHAFYAVSAMLKNELIEWVRVKPDKIFYIPNGVDVDRFKIIDSYLDREKFGLKNDDFIIGAVGRLHYLKNYSLLISIIPEILKKVTKLKVIFIGEGEEKENLLNIIKELNLEAYVKFLGYNKEVVPFYQCMDLLIQPSLTEGMSNTILEAMACSKPVIASNIGGNPEMVVDGITGYLFSLDRKDIFLEKILLLAFDKEKRQSMGKAARTRIEESFSLERMVKNYENLYRRVYYSLSFD
ncbi:MAG: glycosyltransferase [Actinomycetota bacterium]